MALYDQLKNTLQTNIYQNSAKAVTGNILQTTLMSFINTLGEGSGYMGLLSSNNKPTAAVDGKQFYLGTNSGATAVSVDCSAVGLGTITITRSTLWLVWSDGTGWHKQDLSAGLAALIPHDVTDLADHENYQTVEAKEDVLTGNVTINELDSNTAYVCQNCESLTISNYGYNTEDATKWLPLHESHILVQTASNFTVQPPETYNLREGDSLGLENDSLYLITVKGILWKIERY